MPTLEITVSVKLDGAPVPGYPITRRATVDETQGFEYEEPADGNTTTFSDIPVGQLTSIQALLLRTDQQVNVRMDGASDAGILLNAGGILVILDHTNDAASNRLRVNNNSGSTAVLKGLAGGT